MVSYPSTLTEILSISKCAYPDFLLDHPSIRIIYWRAVLVRVCVSETALCRHALANGWSLRRWGPSYTNL
jgi:hypothetical protein